MINIKAGRAQSHDTDPMKPLLRFLWLLCLLPGLATGSLPLPGQAAGLEMVICADGAEHVIRVGLDGQPVETEEDCALCCVACGPTPALLPDIISLPRPALRASGAILSPRSAVLPARAALFPAPRGPPARTL
ncbi:MAG: hypothetical protein CVT70_04225 [Alphaproteobacteria bacterium HGW-Alphaproteobacteria-1]|nr:MAG: hypothetical protein CVT70_04225 [Alphaproteobacteria bacterium HGW-Alphaproteobacteria-1]